MLDLLVTGAIVIDPASGVTGRRDLGVSCGRVAALEEHIPSSSALKTLDASGLYIFPGLVDTHTHIYSGATYWGVRPGPVAWRTGVTTWVDAGSAGAFNLSAFARQAQEFSPLRVRALLNSALTGLVARTGELERPDSCDNLVSEKIIAKHREFIVGIKVRIGIRTVGSRGLAALLEARGLAERCELPLMVHIGQGPPAIEEIVAELRPGDILTHCTRSAGLVDPAGQISADVRRALDSGIVLDVGHGTGAFSFPVAEALLEAGYPPHVISSDLHCLSLHGPMFDLPTCLSKYLALGLDLPTAVEAATSTPARVLGLGENVGNLRVGAPADFGVFALDEGNYAFYDVDLVERRGRYLLRNVLTVIAGQALAPELPEEPPPWVPLTQDQRQELDLLEVRARSPFSVGRDGISYFSSDTYGTTQGDDSLPI